MKRPLAIFGFAYLLSMLVVLRLSGVAQLVVALCLVAALVLLVVLRPKGRNAILLVLASALLAVGLHAMYDVVVVRPVQSLAGSEALVTARVTDIQPGYSPDTMHATLQVLSLDAQPCTPFSVQVRGVETAGIGDIVSLQLRFGTFATASAQRYGYAKGMYVAATARSPVDIAGYDPSFLCRMRQLQYGASASIRQKLPNALSSVIAAMTVGDKRYLSDDTVLDFRMAGLSHMLVVSGLHVSVVSGVVYTAAAALLRRKKAAAAATMVYIALFMCFTGLTPSVVRSGVAYLLVFSAGFFSRKADIYTSLGFAALLLCLQNPYAAADVGLQLSFAATLGALVSSQITQRVREKRAQKSGGKKGKSSVILKKALHWIASTAFTSVCVSLAILPVLCVAGMGISLATVPMNIIGVPALAPIVLAGFVMILPGGIPVLGLVVKLAAFVGGALTALLETLTALCARIPGVWLPLGGLFSLAVVAGVYLLVFLAWKNRGHARRVVAYGLCAVLVFPLAAFLHSSFAAGTVTVLTTGGANPSVVIFRENQAVVLYKGLTTDAALHRIFRERNLQECVLLIDLRRTVHSNAYRSRYNPFTVVFAEEDIINQAVYSPLPDVTVYLKRQAGGSIVCVDIGGYKLGVTNGKVNLAPYARLDLLVAGQSEVTGEYGTLLVTGRLPDWVPENTQILQSTGNAAIAVRPGVGARYTEVQDGIDTG